MTNGAQALIRTLVDAGVDTCFTNPGTSEIHFVAALDSVPEMRAILTLFEGVATGAADGYARMADAPAATLLHLGPGLGNGVANLHNARRARVPVVNIVGDHATYHAQYDPPLQSDIETIARNVSAWVRTSRSAEELCRDAVEAIAAATGPPGQVATLIVPADVSWQDGAEPAPPPQPATPSAASERSSRPWRRRSEAATGRASCSAVRPCVSADSSPPARIAASHRSEAVRREGRAPSGTRCRPAGRRAARVLAGARLESARGAGAPGPGGRASARRVVRLPGREQLAGARRMRGARALAAHLRRDRKPRGAG